MTKIGNSGIYTKQILEILGITRAPPYTFHYQSSLNSIVTIKPRPSELHPKGWFSTSRYIYEPKQFPLGDINKARTMCFQSIKQLRHFPLDLNWGSEKQCVLTQPSNTGVHAVRIKPLSLGGWIFCRIRSTSLFRLSSNPPLPPVSLIKTLPRCWGIWLGTQSSSTARLVSFRTKVSQFYHLFGVFCTQPAPDQCYAGLHTPPT